MVCIIVFVILAMIPALYGMHLLVLAIMAARRRPEVRAEQQAIIADYQANVPDEQWPVVTTQLPLYNEKAVARRIIEAAARMDYPIERHEIQVLDDSSDETREIVDRVAAELSAKGYVISVVRRPDRSEYKAGALKHGMTVARGQYLAVFDADFIPGRDFLRQMIPLLDRDSRAACVQGRWGHLNTGESWISESLALALDGHHAIEQAARSWNGLCLGFNGTGGIWRRAAIEDPDVGGWSGDTITEDLELSYRAQMAGWHIIYNVDVVAPAELPANVDALKTQQRRWATGSIQTARKLLPTVWRSGLTFLQKVEATIHLTQYSVSVFMLLMIGCGRLLLEAVPPQMEQAWLIWMLPMLPLMVGSPIAAYIYARRSIGGGWSGVWSVPKLIIMSLGLSINNTHACAIGLVQRGGEFVRTPKSGSSGKVVRRQAYSALRSRLWLAEVLLGSACFFNWLIFLRDDHYIGGTFMLLYAIGLVSLGWASRPWADKPQAPRRTVPTPSLDTSPAV